MLCPDCKVALPDGARFCNVCGAPVLQQATCARCGQPIKPGQKFCMNCGAPASESGGVPAQIAAEPAPMYSESAQIIPPVSAVEPASPGRRGKWWLWLIPVALVAALAVAAIALDLPGKLTQRLQIAGGASTTGSPANPEVLWTQVQERQAAGAWDDVLALLTQLRAADPEGGLSDASYQPDEVSALLATACANLARQAEQAEDAAAASSHWACALQERPEDTEALAGKGRADLYLAGQADLDAKRYSDAIAAWDELRRVAPDYANVADRLYLAYVAYGEALCATGEPGDISEGRKQYGLARGLAPARPEAIEKLRACQLPTPTPLPTVPPTPTPTPLPGPHLGVISDDVTTLRVRSGPGVGYFVLGKLTAGDAVTITARTADAAWVQVGASPERVGWVSSEYVTTEEYPVEGAQVVAAPPLPQRLLAAQASADFSSQQGFREWFYLVSTAPGSSQYVRMPFDSDGTYRWCCDRNYSSAMRVWSAGAYPSARNDAVRLWVSPYDGQLHIYGVARKEPRFGSGGNGSVVRILQNQDLLWEDVLGSSDASSITFDLTVASKSGDSFYFVVGARGDDFGDSTLFAPTIELLHPEGVDAPTPARWAEPVPVAAAAPAPPPPPALCFEPRLRHYEEHKGSAAEIAGLVYNRQGKPYGPAGAALHIEGPPAIKRYVRDFGVDAGGGYSVTALSVDKYSIWLKGPNIRSKQYAVEYPDWAKIRIIVDFYQVACW